MATIDEQIRQLDIQTAIVTLPEMWQRVHAHLEVSRTPVEDQLYMRVLRYSARRVLGKLEEEEPFSEKTWRTYRDFFTHLMLSKGTVECGRLLLLSERIVTTVVGYATKPLPLLAEYDRCVLAQQDQRKKALHAAAVVAATVVGSSSPTPAVAAASVTNLAEPASVPDLERDPSKHTALMPKLPLAVVTQVLSSLPAKMTFAHSSGILYLKMCNPLRIPECKYVCTGYTCDSCGLRNMRVAYEATLYDDETSPGDVPHGNAPLTTVRSDAIIAMQHSHGFDMCVACAVHFYHSHLLQFARCARPPHIAFRVGHASGIRITAGSCTAASVAATPKSPSTFKLSKLSAAAGGGTTPKRATPRVMKHRSGSSVAVLSPETSSGHTTPKTGRSSVTSSTCGGKSLTSQAATTTPKSMTGPSTSNSGTLVSPMKSITSAVAVAGGGGIVHLTAYIAPWGARPIAWVARVGSPVPANDEDANTIAQCHRTVFPPSDWKTRMTFTCDTASATEDTGSSFHLPSKHLDVIELSDVVEGLGDQPGVFAGAASPASHVAAASAPTPCVPSKPGHSDTCVICLNALDDSDMPVIETTCHHWFHVECIEGHTTMNGNTCPLCRAVEVLPDMSTAATLQCNRYHIQLKLTEDDMAQDELYVFVGALITGRRAYDNVTNIASAECVRVHPRDQRKTFHLTIE